MKLMVHIERLVMQFARKNIKIVILFLLPFNVLYRLYAAFLDLKMSKEEPSDATHERKKKRVEEQVKMWRAAGAKKKLCTGRMKTHSTMYRLPAYRDTLHNIQVDDLNDIISIDEERKVVKVEPMVTMGELTKTLIGMGWTIPVVPEFETLTVGGLVMGGGIETSSHKYGLFHRTCESYELVVSSGDAIICSKDQNVDLYNSIPFSYGTLGFLTAVEIEIIKAKKFVRLEYHPAHTFEDAVKLLENHARNTSANDFVEAILYSRNKWVIMAGKMVAEAEAQKINKIGLWYKPWFFKHVEKYLDAGYGIDYIPLRDYYHRHTRCTFWMSAPFLPFANEPIFRYVFGWSLPFNVRFLKSLLPDALIKFKALVQDFLVPIEAISDVISESERLTQLYPVWVCPFILHADETMWKSGRNEDVIFYDIGVYGRPEMSNFSLRTSTKELEAVTRKHKGIQVLYGDTYLTDDEFRDMFDLGHYETMRKKYDAESAFPDIYSKISMKGRIQGL